MKTLRASLFSLMLVNLIKKKHSKFSHCYTGLDVECSTKEAIEENHENTIYAYFAVVI